MEDLLIRISNGLYSWVLDPRLESFIPIYANYPQGGYGQKYGLIFLLLISLAAVLIYYFVIASKVKNCCMKNYVTVCVLGLVTLLVVNVVGFSCLIKNTQCLFDTNLLCFSLVDILYYFILFEIFSWCFKGMSNDKNRSFIQYFFPNKKS